MRLFIVIIVFNVYHCGTVLWSKTHHHSFIIQASYMYRSPYRIQRAVLSLLKGLLLLCVCLHTDLLHNEIIDSTVKWHLSIYLDVSRTLSAVVCLVDACCLNSESLPYNDTTDMYGIYLLCLCVMWKLRDGVRCNKPCQVSWKYSRKMRSLQKPLASTKRRTWGDQQRPFTRLKDDQKLSHRCYVTIE